MRRLNKSFINISLVSSGNVFNAALGFLFLAAVAKQLNIEDFGKYALLSSLLVSVSRILDFGTDSFFVARSMTNKDYIFSDYLSAKIILLVITIPITLLALYIVELLSLETFLIFVLGLVAYCVNYTLFALFQKAEKFHFAVLLNTLPAVIKGIFAILVLFGLIQLNYIFAFSVFSIAMISSGFLYFFLPTKINFENLSFNFSRVLKLILNASPAGGSLVITNSWQAISNTMAKLVKNFGDVGIFSLANKIANIFTLLSLSVFTVLLPKNARKKSTNADYDIKELYLLGFGMLILAMISVGISKTFILGFFGDKFAGSIALLDILIFASAFSAIHNFLENFFFVENETGMLFKLTVSKLGLFALISVILIKTNGIAGIAWGQLISSIFALIATFWIIHKKFLYSNGSSLSET